MNERPDLPNYDPEFCLKVVQLAATACVGWLTIGLLILTFTDPGNGQCPEWTIHSKDGQAISLWLLFGLFTVLPTIWICSIVLRWERFSERVYESAAGTHRPFSNLMPKFLYDRYNPDPFTFPHNRVFVVVSVGWSVFCTAPLWLMLTNCTTLPRYLGY